MNLVIGSFIFLIYLPAAAGSRASDKQETKNIILDPDDEVLLFQKGLVGGKESVSANTPFILVQSGKPQHNICLSRIFDEDTIDHKIP